MPVGVIDKEGREGIAREVQRQRTRSSLKDGRRRSERAGLAGWYCTYWSESWEKGGGWEGRDREPRGRLGREGRGERLKIALSG